VQQTDLAVEEQVTEGSLTIAASSSYLLDVRLDVLWHVKVDDSANVRLVQTHAECYGGDDDANSTVHKVFLYVLACDARHAGVVAIGRPCTVLLGLLTLLGLALQQTQTTTESLGHPSSEHLQKTNTRMHITAAVPMKFNQITKVQDII